MSREILMGDRSPYELQQFLRAEFLPCVLAEMNTPDVRRRIGLYGGDRIPENERNLTDVRNRVSLIAEYEMARVGTRLLEEMSLSDLFFSYVVANRFPDLELRDRRGRRGVRLEVKCLASIAEEKSANFDTLKKDVHPDTDFLVIFLWEWQRDGAIVGPDPDRNDSFAWDRAPSFLSVYCFHAASLAHMRDWYWLNRPPANVRPGLQGFDLRYGVNCRQGAYNEEEGNYGKLMRMWSEGFGPAPPRTTFLEATPAEYLLFRRDVVEKGFEQVCRALASEALGGALIEPLVFGRDRIGWNTGEVAFILSSLTPTKARDQVLRDGTARSVICFSDKYAWSEFVLRQGRAHKVQEGRKPKHLKAILMDRAGN